MKKIANKIEYLAISVDKLKKCSPEVPINFYIKLGAVGDSEKEPQAKYAQLFSKTSGIDYARLARYVHKGVKDLYIKKEDAELFEQFLNNKEEPKNSTEDQIKFLLQKTDQVLSEIFEGSPLLKETAIETKELVKNYIQTLYSKPNQLKILLEISTHGDVLYSHSLSVAVFSLFIAKNFGEFGQDFFENLTIGALFHDVGYIRLKNFDIDVNEEDVTPEEWILHQSHTKLGLEVIAPLNDLPEDVRYIVYQHHEHMDGRGYPNRLRGDSIFILSQIVCLADVYCTEWSRFIKEEKNVSEWMMLKKMESKKNYFHPKVFESFYQIFGDLKKKSHSDS